MAQFTITKGPNTTDLMFALFDMEHPHCVKFTVQGLLYGKQRPETTTSAEDKIYREIYDADIPPHEIEVDVTAVKRAGVRGTGCWWVTGQTDAEEIVLCCFWTTVRGGDIFTGKDAEDKLLWLTKNPYD